VGIGSGIAGAAPATFALIAINVAAFIAELASPGNLSLAGGGSKLINQGGLYGPAVAHGDWYRIITSAFLHEGLLHIGLNMFVLYIMGRMLEPAIGTVRFVGIYVVSLLAGSLGVIVLSPNSLSVGASGAIFGLLAAAFVIARQRGLDALASQIGFWVIINIVFTFSVPNISIGAHLGGLVGGGIAALVVLWGERTRNVPAELLALAVLAAGCFVAALALA
jgi:membrane associated rhomboid family serine protease